jgi:abequosyltransferase
MSQVLEPRRLALTHDERVAAGDSERLFRLTAAYLSFIGAVVIRRRIWLERDRAAYFGSLFVHFGVIFQRPLPGPTHIIAAPLISIRYGNALWRPAEFEVWMFKWPALVWSIADVSQQAKQAVCRLEPWRKPTTLVFLRAKGSYSLDTYRRWIKPRAHGLVARLAAAVIAALPGPILNALAVFWCSTVRRETPMMTVELKNSPYHFRNWLAVARR